MPNAYDGEWVECKKIIYARTKIGLALKSFILNYSMIGYRFNLYPLFYFNIFIYYNSEDRKFIQMKGEKK